MAQSIPIISGSTVKVQLFWAYPSNPAITLDSINNVSFYVYCNGSLKMTIAKSGLVREEVETATETIVNWYAYIDTTGMCGNLLFRIKTEIPDADAPGSKMPDIKEWDPRVMVVM